MADRVKGGDPKTDQEGTTRTPGWHPEVPNCQRQIRYSRTAWAASTHCEGKGPENPGVVAPLADAGCRGNRAPMIYGCLEQNSAADACMGFHVLYGQ